MAVGSSLEPITSRLHTLRPTDPKTDMNELAYADGLYRTQPAPVPLIYRASTSLAFYFQFLLVVFRASVKARWAEYDGAAWAKSSIEVLRALERVGVRIEVSGVDHFASMDGPCVFISNHMSMLETMVLPCIIQPFKEVTFVVKRSLLDYPVFKHVMRSRDPVAVSRTNPREDLKEVLQGGTEKLQAGRSIVVFPQTTRTLSLDPDQFNTIGVKLAKKAGVPVVPVALMTDAWSNGRYLKDFGKIDRAKEVHFEFAEPMTVQGRGTEEHEVVVEFITTRHEKWRGERESAAAPEP